MPPDQSENWIDELNGMEEETLLEQERIAGNQLYSYHSLVHDLHKIETLKESTLYHRKDCIEVQENQVYSKELEKRINNKDFSTKDFSILFGDKAQEVFHLLQDQGYVEAKKGRIRIRSKFKISSLEDFKLTGASSWEPLVFQGLQSLLIQEYYIDADPPSPVVELMFSRDFNKTPKVRNSSKDYLFRLGNNLITVDFKQAPSPELLELVRLRLELVFEENMVNFFQIVSSYTSDETIWAQKRDKSEIFFETLGNLLENSWKLFDLEECRVVISGGTGQYSFCNGQMVYKLDTEGKSSFTFGEKADIPDLLEDVHREYRIHSMQISMNKESFEPVLMDLYMKSRSLHNINPRKNYLHHKFILMLIENLSKIIDQAILALDAEKMKKHLAWKAFLDHNRLRSMGWGEDLYRIIVDAVGVFRVFLKIEEASFYIEDPEFKKMLAIYKDNHPSIGPNFKLLDELPSDDQRISENLISVKLLESIGEKVYLFFALEGESLPSRTKENYLEDRPERDSLIRLAAAHQIKLDGELIYDLLNNCLSSNPMITMAHMVERWTKDVPPGQRAVHSQRISQFAAKLKERYEVFFDILQNMDNNLEAGITNMRGSRDRLTGLYNRQKFNQHLESHFADSHSFGLMFIDMDTFKIYNDAISHSFGDLLLIGLSERILEIAREYNNQALPGRFGGDEFCFALIGRDQESFEETSCRVFKRVTGEPEKVLFFYEERRARGWEVNAISFLHRLLRPDVGGIRGAASEFVEPQNANPRERLLTIYGYYVNQERDESDPWLEEVKKKDQLEEEDITRISRYLVQVIIGKIVMNGMFRGYEGDFSATISLFIEEQLRNRSTQEIRETLAEFLGDKKIILDMHYKISAGLSHTSEDRLRSVSALFKAADSRAYIAKHNGRNGLFGLNNQRLL